MKISSVNIFRYNNIKPNNTFNSKHKINQESDCFQLSFEGKNLKKTIEKIGKENFPSNSIYDFTLEKSISNPEESLYEVHKEFYKDLLNCSTLEEAKELYPEELKDILNVSDLPKETLPMLALKPILGGQVEDVTLDNLSLNIIKQYYAEKTPLRDRKTYFLIGAESLSKLMDMLNIKKYNKSYDNALAHSIPERIEKASKNTKSYFKNNANARENMSKKMHDSYQQNPQKRENVSKKLKQYYKQNPKAKENISKRIKDYYENNPEAREEKSKKLKEVYKQNPQYGQLSSQRIRQYYAIEENNKNNQKE